MAGNRREPDGINRKRKRRRTPEEIEEIRRRVRLQGEGSGEKKRRRPSGEDNETPRKRRKKKKLPNKKKILIGLLVVFIALLSIGAISVGVLLGKIKSNDLEKAKKPAPNEPVNILVLGLDIGDPTQSNNYDVKRTDTMMVAQYNPKQKDLDIVSIPRDILVTEEGRNYKMNAAYQKGGETKTKEKIEELLAIEINYTVIVDYNAFRQFIDAIGGIDMEIEQDMYYDDAAQNLHINFEGGTVAHLDGKKAEEFFRWRQNNDGTGLAMGDLGRIENQHKFISKVVEKCTSPSIVLKMTDIIGAVGDNVKTNMPVNKILSYGLDFTGIDTSTVKMWTVQGDFKNIGGQEYVVYNESYNKELMKAIHNEGNSDVNKEEVSIVVLNGTKINGLAGEVKDKLKRIGWKVVDVGNGNPTSKTTVCSDDEEAIKLLKKELPEITKSDSKYSNSTYDQYDVVIIIGDDFKKLGE